MGDHSLPTADCCCRPWEKQLSPHLDRLSSPLLSTFAVVLHAVVVVVSFCRPCKIPSLPTQQTANPLHSNPITSTQLTVACFCWQQLSVHRAPLASRDHGIEICHCRTAFLIPRSDRAPTGCPRCREGASARVGADFPCGCCTGQGGPGLAGWCVCGTDYCLDGTGWCISPGYSDVGRRKGAETRAEGSISASEGKTLGAGDFATQQCHCQRNTAYCAGSIARRRMACCSRQYSSDCYLRRSHSSIYLRTIWPVNWRLHGTACAMVDVDYGTNCLADCEVARLPAWRGPRDSIQEVRP